MSGMMMGSGMELLEGLGVMMLIHFVELLRSSNMVLCVCFLSVAS